MYCNSNLNITDVTVIFQLTKDQNYKSKYLRVKTTFKMNPGLLKFGITLILPSSDALRYPYNYG